MDTVSENTYSVYIHTNKVNNKKYVGITKQDPVVRWGYKGLGYLHCCKFWNAIQKYGWENFAHEIYSTNISKEEACETEKRLIKEFGTQDDRFGYNIDEGGSVPKHTPETIEKIRRANIGKYISDETREKIREARLKQDYDYSHLIEYARSRKGVPQSDETKQKMKDFRRKDFKPVLCEETNLSYESITEASRQTGIGKGSISTSCNSDGRLQAKGFHFHFI